MPPFQSFHPHDCILKSERIDIWEYPLHTESSNDKTLLNQDESERADRFHFARHRRRYTVAHAWLRRILAQYLSFCPEDLTFTKNPHGKPALLNLPTLQFNLSHSNDLALLAVGFEFPLGIDLEFFSPRPYQGIGKHLFSAAENQSLANLPIELQPLGFFHLWSQKEALSKACGLGLSYPTKQVDFPILPPTNEPIHDPLYGKTWQIISFMPQTACCAALCHHPRVTEIRYLALDASTSLL